MGLFSALGGIFGSFAQKAGAKRAQRRAASDRRKATAELKDESSEIQIANYLSKALVYYVKAKYLEDIFKFQESELLMVKFQKLVEKYNNSIISGPRMIASGPYGIK